MNSINYKNNPTFKCRIITGQNLKRKISDPKCPKLFVNKFIALKYKCYDENLSEFKNINLLLDYTNTDGYYATVISKKGIPISVGDNGQFKNISLSDKCIANLKKWISHWNNFSSPKL